MSNPMDHQTLVTTDGDNLIIVTGDPVLQDVLRRMAGAAYNNLPPQLSDEERGAGGLLAYLIDELDERGEAVQHRRGQDDGADDADDEEEGDPYIYAAVEIFLNGQKRLIGVSETWENARILAEGSGRHYARLLIESFVPDDPAPAAVFELADGERWVKEERR